MNDSSEKVSYSDIFGNIQQQKNITVLFGKLIDERNRQLHEITEPAMKHPAIHGPVHARNRAVQQRDRFMINSD